MKLGSEHSLALCFGRARYRSHGDPRLAIDVDRQADSADHRTAAERARAGSGQPAERARTGSGQPAEPPAAPLGVDIEAGGLFGSVERAELEARLELRSGRYELTGRSARADQDTGAPAKAPGKPRDGAGPRLVIAEQTALDVQLRIERSADQSRLTRLRLDASRALRLENLGATTGELLAELNPLAGALGALLEQIPAPLRALAGLTGAAADAAVTFDLQALELEAAAGGGGALRMLLSGSLCLLDRITLPLAQLPLPLPLTALPADVELLIARLASCLQRSTTLRAMAAALVHEVLDRGDGTLSCTVAAPTVCGRAGSSDGTELTAELRTEAPFRVGGPLSILCHDRSGVRLDCPRLELHTAAEQGALSARCELLFDRPDPAAPVGWRGPQITASLETDGLLPLPSLLLMVAGAHPLASGSGELRARLHEVRLQGACGLALRGRTLRLTATSPARLEARIDPTSELQLSRQGGSLHSRPGGRIEARYSGARPFELSARAQLTTVHELSAQLEPLVELGIPTGRLFGQISDELQLELQLRAQGVGGERSASLRGSRAGWQLRCGELLLDERRLELPPTRVELAVERGGLDRYGPLDATAIALRWDTGGEPVVLRHGDREVFPLTPALLDGELTLHLSPTGQLSFAGDRRGLYGVSYFNALLNPAAHARQLLQLLDDDDASDRIAGALDLLSTGARELFCRVRATYLRVRETMRRESITQPADFIPRQAMARTLSLVLRGDTALVEQLSQIIRRVTDGDGLDVVRLRELLSRELADLELDYEIGALCSWLRLLFDPGEPLSLVAADDPPVVRDERYAEQLEGLPSAAEIYRAADQPRVEPELAAKIASVAPELSLAQLDYLLDSAEESQWGSDNLARLRRAAAFKRRAAALAEQYGGIEHALQSLVITRLLGDALGPLVRTSASSAGPAARGRTSWPRRPLALGPAEIGVLLHAGLAAGHQGLRVQLNNRMLLELLRRGEPELTERVLIELGHQRPRALAGILYAFLEQSQDQLRDPLDLVALLSERLGLEVPRQRDFLAGGPRARDSYYAALSSVADRLAERADRHLARKHHLQRVRHPPPAAPRQRSNDAVEADARSAIEQADRLGRRRTTSAEDDERARQAYLHACDRCAELLAHEPAAIALPWLKRFWQRNEEALRVLSVVRAHQRDVDRVRHWLAIRSGRGAPETEPELCRAVIDALYLDSEQRRAIGEDPLVQLLIDPPPGRYRFSIVSCMGVITGGERGTELEEAFARLREQRGVTIVRAHTGTGRSLEYNAQRIIEAIERCRTPWGIVGYSQGCANALLAESMLLGGTPRQQRLLDGLVCRNMLFSAANGSAHGTASDLKFLRAMVQGERILKHYQALYSWAAIRLALRALRDALDAPLFVSLLGGTHSVSFERAQRLHRDSQLRSDVPTSHTRAVVTADRLPEALEYFFHLHDKLASGEPQDTQVLLEDAVGHATRTKNAYTEALARCDMGSTPQATHHWAPLTREVDFVTTERDRELAIYESPLDQLVWPWVEVNARFGRIERVS